MEPSDIPDSSATVLYVGNLDNRVTDQMMLNILRTGLHHIKDNILSASMFQSPDMNNPEGYCFVQFLDNSSACQALTFLNGRDFCGKKVKVSWATNSSTGAPKVLGTSVSIYIGNLDDNINENDLQAAFDPFGEILNIKIVRDPATNRSKNIAFISYSSKLDAEKAIRDMHGAVLKGRAIKTNWASRSQNQRRDEQDYDEVFKASPVENCTIYVGGIPNYATDDMVRSHFQVYGNILDLRIFAAKNYGFIRYESHAAAATAICKTNGTEMGRSHLKCWWSKDDNASTNNNSTYNERDQRMISLPNQQDYSQFNQYTDMSQMTQQQYQYMQQYMQYQNYWMQNYQQMQMQGTNSYQHGDYQQMNQQQGRNDYEQQSSQERNQRGQRQRQNNYPRQNYYN